MVDELPERPEVVSTQPAPHPLRPQEMWHPAVVGTQPSAVEPVDLGAEERVHPADLVEPEAGLTTSRFRFARLRPVGPTAQEPSRRAGRSAVPPTEEAAEPGPSLLEELLAPSGVASEHPEPIGHGTAPLVPTTNPPAGGALINGPVNRRTPRDDGFIRRRDLPVTLTGVDPAAPPLTASSAPVGEVPGAEVLVAEVLVAEAHLLEVRADGTVELVGGHLRLAEGLGLEVRQTSDRIDLDLVRGWCWTSLTGDALPVTVTMPAGPLTVPAGTEGPCRGRGRRVELCGGRGRRGVAGPPRRAHAPPTPGHGPGALRW